MVSWRKEIERGRAREKEESKREREKGRVVIAGPSGISLVSSALPPCARALKLSKNFSRAEPATESKRGKRDKVSFSQ